MRESTSKGLIARNPRHVPYTLLIQWQRNIIITVITGIIVIIIGGVVISVITGINKIVANQSDTRTGGVAGNGQVAPTTTFRDRRGRMNVINTDKVIQTGVDGAPDNTFI